ncbi:MAG TPA: glycosyltransferase [Flavipsychrobacter sp.]|nr:glycosyltransferase [Flavipsychrobacter sp.]
MKILFLANRIPYPPYRGDKLKIYNLTKRLYPHHELHLLTFTESEEDKNYIKPLEEIFTKVATVHLPRWKGAFNCLKGIGSSIPFQVLYFQSAAMKAKLADFLQENSYDAIHVQHLRMSTYLQHQSQLPRILDLPDAFSLYWKRRQQVEKSFWKNTFERIEQKRLESFEAIIKDYPMTLVCSQEDLMYLEQLHSANNLRLLPNGVDTTTFRYSHHDYSHQHTLLFTGNMDYAPNVDAVTFFVDEMLPKVKAQFPNIQLVIAGQRPIEKVKALACEYITVTGFVKDLSAMYAAASVVISPLRFGAGTQNKVLEAMAMGVPVVCTEVGFKGLGIADGDGVFSRKDPQAFIDQLAALLSDESLRKTTGEKGRKVIEEKFDWDVITRKLETYFKEVCAL